MNRIAILLVAAACLLGAAACSDPPAAGNTLSSKHLFDDIASQTPADGVIPYELNTPLFADYTTKHRFIHVPDGMTVGWSADGALDFPVGTTLVKTFAYLHDRRDPAQGERLLETRLLVRGDDGWTGSSFVYNDEGTDAVEKAAGTTIEASWTHDDGSMRSNQYVVPNKNQCKECHAEHEEDTISLLGPKARHLNRDGQLENLVAMGLLTGAPTPDMWPKAARAFDPSTGTLDERARAWLDITCGHCHNPQGLARTSGLYLDHAETDLAVVGKCKPPVATGRGSGGRLYDIVPGKPDESIIMYRLESTDPEAKMPELGRNLVDEQGVALIREWITAMTGACATAN